MNNYMYRKIETLSNDDWLFSADGVVMFYELWEKAGWPQLYEVMNEWGVIYICYLFNGFLWWFDYYGLKSISPDNGGGVEYDDEDHDGLRVVEYD